MSKHCVLLHMDYAADLPEGNMMMKTGYFLITPGSTVCYKFFDLRKNLLIVMAIYCVC